MSFLDRWSPWRLRAENSRWRSCALEFMNWHLARHAGKDVSGVVDVCPHAVEGALAFVMTAVENCSDYAKDGLAERDQLRAKVERLTGELESTTRALDLHKRGVRGISASVTEAVRYIEARNPIGVDRPMHAPGQGDEESDA